MIAAVPNRTFRNAPSRDSRRHILPQAISAWSERSEVKKIPAISEYSDIL